MGLITRLLGLSRATSEIGAAVEGVAEVFVPNATKKMTLSHDAYMGALDEFGSEFAYIRDGWFDRFVNGLNRLPRPALAIGTLGLFTYAMIAPEHFSIRMQGLSLVPEPLWWLLGAIVSFYFGSREMFYFRGGKGLPTYKPQKPLPVTPAVNDRSNDNAALSEWRNTTAN